MQSDAPNTPSSATNAADTANAGGSAFAALDLGTNNCRLLIAKPAPELQTAGGLKVLDSFSRIVRLGEGVSNTGALSLPAMDRTIAALHHCRRKLDRFPQVRGEYVATEACRKASNTPEFLERVRSEVGLDIKVISAEEEARLAFMGCAAFLKPSVTHALIFDIGGGSTELLWVSRPLAEADAVQPPRIVDWQSMPSGVMNLAEKFGGAGMSEVYFDDIVNFLIEKIQPFEDRNRINDHLDKGDVQMLSTSGTVTTLAAVHLDLPRYDRSKIDGLTLSTEELQQATHRILNMRPSERFSNPCIGPDRSDFILSGCAIFEAICQVWQMESITIADRGVREGIIMSLIQEGRK